MANEQPRQRNSKKNDFFDALSKVFKNNHFHLIVNLCQLGTFSLFLFPNKMSILANKISNNAKFINSDRTFSKDSNLSLLSSHDIYKT
jgi:hypothetical protein